ncbi:hypothetical protein JRQ81_019334, partial [Phrynocephalus forsythii]
MAEYPWSREGEGLRREDKLEDSAAAAMGAVGHGTCDCGKCRCDEAWYGDACQYPRTCNLTRKKSNEMCKNSQDNICSNA